MFYLRNEFEKEGTIEIDPRKEEIVTITKQELKNHQIHGLFTLKNSDQYIQVALETSDNQIDFNQLTVESLPRKGEDITFKYGFAQTLEIVPRPIKMDNIKEF